MLMPEKRKLIGSESVHGAPKYDPNDVELVGTDHEFAHF